MARRHSLDLRNRIVDAVEAGLSRRAAATRFAISQSCAIKPVQHWKRTGNIAPLKGAKKSFALSAHEELVRTLVASHPDLTLDELWAQLVAEGTAVGRTSVHRYLEALGLARKKDTPCRGAKAPRRRCRPDDLAAGPGRSEPGTSGLHRRNLDQDQHGTALWSCSSWPAPGRFRTSRILDDQHLPRRHAPRCNHCAMRDRRPDQRRDLHSLFRAVPGSDPGRGRHRHHGQSQLPQGQHRAHCDRDCRRVPPLPAALQSRSQFHRTGLRQAQGAASQSRRSHRQDIMGHRQSTSPALQPDRMRQLLQRCWLCST